MAFCTYSKRREVRAFGKITEARRPLFPALLRYLVFTRYRTSPPTRIQNETEASGSMEIECSISWSNLSSVRRHCRAERTLGTVTVRTVLPVSIDDVKDLLIVFFGGPAVCVFGSTEISGKSEHGTCLHRDTQPNAMDVRSNYCMNTFLVQEIDF